MLILYLQMRMFNKFNQQNFTRHNKVQENPP